MAGGDHDAAVKAAIEGRKVHTLGAAQADVADIHTRVDEASDEPVAQLRTAEADVTAHGHALGLYEGRIGLADLISQRVVDLVGDAATNVVGLEAVQVHVLVPWRP